MIWGIELMKNWISQRGRLEQCYCKCGASTWRSCTTFCSVLVANVAVAVLEWCVLGDPDWEPDELQHFVPVVVVWWMMPGVRPKHCYSSQYVEGSFLKLSLRDSWDEVDETWHVYFMHREKKLLGSGILNFGSCAVREKQHTSTGVLIARRLGYCDH